MRALMRALRRALMRALRRALKRELKKERKKTILILIALKSLYWFKNIRSRENADRVSESS